MTTDKEAVVTIYEEGKLVAVIVYDKTLRNPIVYRVEKMGIDEIAELIDKKDERTIGT